MNSHACSTSPAIGRSVAAGEVLPVADPSRRVQADGGDLRYTLAHWRSRTGYGRGIAAPQIGILQRVIFLKLPDAEPWPLINPEIVARSEEKIVVWDACLSFLSIFMQVERHREITVRYQNLNGETLEFGAGKAKNLSELLQHEIDHLDGILAIDRVIDVKTIATGKSSKRDIGTRARMRSPLRRRHSRKFRSIQRR